MTPGFMSLNYGQRMTDDSGDLSPQTSGVLEGDMCAVLSGAMPNNGVYTDQETERGLCTCASRPTVCRYVTVYRAS